jgi:WD40 repeat protein
MSSIRASKFKNVFFAPEAKEDWYKDVQAHQSTSDNGMVASSHRFVAYSSVRGAGSAVSILPLTTTAGSKSSGSGGSITGHAGAINDLCFSPFNDCILATGAVDGAVRLWSLPEAGLTGDLSQPIFQFDGTKDKIVNLMFHPSANNVVMAADTKQVHMIDVATGTVIHDQGCHPDTIFSACLSYTGGLVATTCKDKALRLFDVRKGGSAANSCNPHAGTKGVNLNLNLNLSLDLNLILNLALNPKPLNLNLEQKRRSVSGLGTQEHW